MKTTVAPSPKKIQNFSNRRPELTAQDKPMTPPAEQTIAAEDIPERPTTFELAQLAVILATRRESLRISPAEVVLEAMQVWEAAAQLNLTERHERENCALSNDQ